AAPASAPAPAAPAAPSPPAVRPRRRPRALLLVAGAGVGVAALVLAVVVATWRPPRPAAPVLGPAAATPEAFAGRAAIKSGHLARAGALAEASARTHPADARAFALLGDVLFLQSEKERGLAAYREAVRMDRGIGDAADLLANLRATFADPSQGEAAF